MTARCGNGATPPGSKPVACTTSSAFATRTSRDTECLGDRTLVGSPVAGDECEHVGAVADEHERLDDLRQLAADGFRRGARRRRPVGELLDAGVDGRRTQHLRDALDRLRPGRHPETIT